MPSNWLKTAMPWPAGFIATAETKAFPFWDSRRTAGGRPRGAARRPGPPAPREPPRRACPPGRQDALHGAVRLVPDRHGVPGGVDARARPSRIPRVVRLDERRGPPPRAGVIPVRPTLPDRPVWW